MLLKLVKSLGHVSVYVLPSLLNIWWWYAYDLLYDWIHPEDAYIKQKSVGEFIMKWLKIYSLTHVHLFVDKCEIILHMLLFESRDFKTFLINWKIIFQFICTIFLLLQLFYLGSFINWQVAALILTIINHLKTKRRPLYLKTQSVPRCKHFSSRL